VFDEKEEAIPSVNHEAKASFKFHLSFDFRASNRRTDAVPQRRRDRPAPGARVPPKMRLVVSSGNALGRLGRFRAHRRALARARARRFPHRSGSAGASVGASRSGFFGGARSRRIWRGGGFVFVVYVDSR